MDRAVARLKHFLGPSICLAALAWPLAAGAMQDGITGRSGKQGATCTACHSGGEFNYQLPTLTGSTTVNASSTNNYTLDFNLNAGSPAAKAGFNLAVSNGGGLLSARSGANPVRVSNNELTHASPGSPSTSNFAWNFTWKAPANGGTVTFFVCATPVNGNAATSGDGIVRCTTFPITVTIAPAPPVAGNDSYSTVMDTPLAVGPPGVLGNDTDPNGDSLTAVLDTTTANGALVLESDGSFSYTPGAGFSGGDSFTYHANDGSLDSPVATVTLTVGASNAAPVAGNDAYAVSHNSERVVAAPGVLANDTDADGDPLAALLVEPPQNGVVMLNANGGFTYTPETGYSGGDSFRYQASDGADQSNVATVTLTVAPPPSGGGGGGAFNFLLLVPVAGLAGLAWRRRHSGGR